MYTLVLRNENVPTRRCFGLVCLYPHFRLLVHSYPFELARMTLMKELQCHAGWLVEVLLCSAKQRQTFILTYLLSLRSRASPWKWGGFKEKPVFFSKKMIPVLGSPTPILVINKVKRDKSVIRLFLKIKFKQPYRWKSLVESSQIIW